MHVCNHGDDIGCHIKEVIHLISINNIIHMVHKNPKHPPREFYIPTSYYAQFKHESKDIKKMNHMYKKGQINNFSWSPPQTLQSNEVCQQWTSLVSHTSQQFFFKVHIRELPFMCDAFMGNYEEEICYFLPEFLHLISLDNIMYMVSTKPKHPHRGETNSNSTSQQLSNTM